MTSSSEAPLTEPGETVAASDEVVPMARPVLLPASRPDRPSGNLPLPLTRLIGRGDEVDGILRALGRRRLVTLVGLGGVGKTRLALEAGGRVAGQFSHGVWFVDLAPLTDETLVPRAVAAVLRVEERLGRSLTETLVNALRDRTMLLVLDNCEHVIEACAVLVEALLRTCPDLRILATSREALRILGEVSWQVSPLAIPPDGQSLSPELLGDLPSVRLFVERAEEARPDFVLSEHNAEAVALICRRLDGLPLLLELAAARVSVLGVHEIADRLDDRFRLLTTGSRTAPPRQQALRAALDWSFDLLTAPERAVFRRISAFPGSFTLDAGCRVAGAGEAEPFGPSLSAQTPGPDAVDTLVRLVSRSLVRLEPELPGPVFEARYRLLETVQHYARERLQEAGETELAQARHAAWCTELAERAEPLLLGPEQVTWLVRMDQEYGNVRAALAWCVEHDPPLGLRLAASLWQFWRVRLYLSEGRQWLERLLAAVPAPTLVRARALAGAGLLAHWQLDLATAQSACEEAVKLARALGDRPLLGQTLRELGTMVAAYATDRGRARALFEEGITISRAVGDRRNVAINLMHQARLAMAEGDYRGVQPLHDESLALLAEVGDRWQLSLVLEDAGGVALVLGQPERAEALFEASIEAGREFAAVGLGAIHRPNHPGSVAFWRGDAETAIRWYEELLAVTRANNHTAGIADNLIGLGRALLLQGDLARATAVLEEALRVSTAHPNRAARGRALHGLGLVAWRAGDAERARKRLRESLAWRRDRAERLGIVESLEALASVELGVSSDEESAARAMLWLGAADALREQMGAPRPPVDQPAYDVAIQAAASRLDDTAELALIGADMSLEAVIGEALSGPSADLPFDASPVPAVAARPLSASRGSTESAPVAAVTASVEGIRPA